MQQNKGTSDYELIQRFFDFELNEEEAIQFDRRTETDLQFQKKIELYKYVEHKVTKDFKSDALAMKAVKTQAWQRQLGNNPIPKRRIGIYQPWRAIAAVVVITLISYLAIQNLGNDKLSYTKLALNTWEDDYPALVERSLTSPREQSKFMDAINSYKAQKYKASLQLLEGITDERALLLKGQVLFRSGKNNKAIAIFQSIIDSQDGGQKDMAYWYQALVYLYLENIGAAKQNLNWIQQENYPMAKDASWLLQELNKISK